MAPAQQQAGLRVSPGLIEGAGTCNTRVWCCNLCGKRTVSDTHARTHYAVVHEVAVAAGKRTNPCSVEPGAVDPTRPDHVLATAADVAAAGKPLRGWERLQGTVTMLCFVPFTRNPSSATMDAQLDYHRVGRTSDDRQWACCVCGKRVLRDSTAARHANRHRRDEAAGTVDSVTAAAAPEAEHEHGPEAEAAAAAAVVAMKERLKARCRDAGAAAAGCDGASTVSDSSGISHSNSITSRNWKARKGHGGSLPLRRLPLRRVVPGTPDPQRPHFRLIDVAAEATRLAAGGLRIVNPPPKFLLFAPFEHRDLPSGQPHGAAGAESSSSASSSAAVAAAPEPVLKLSADRSVSYSTARVWCCTVCGARIVRDTYAHMHAQAAAHFGR